MTGDGGTAVGRKPDRFSFGDQVTDRQREAIIADDDTVAGALGAEDRRRERVVGNIRTEHDDRVQRRLQIERDIRCSRLQFAWKRPLR